tara:strand:+ start:588 stop:857 length:270 start_codon:yes stop_codon:yes gene_type:complete
MKSEEKYFSEFHEKWHKEIKELSAKMKESPHHTIGVGIGSDKVHIYTRGRKQKQWFEQWASENEDFLPFPWIIEHLKGITAGHLIKGDC